MAQDAVKPITYFALKETDALFGEAGRTIDSEIYEVLPKESRAKFKPCAKPSGRIKPSWHPSNIDGIVAMAEAPMPQVQLMDEDPDEDIEDEDHDDDDF